MGAARRNWVGLGVELVASNPSFLAGPLDIDF